MYYVFGDCMYDFANRADLEINFVCHKKNAARTYNCDSRATNSLVYYISGGHIFYHSGRQIKIRAREIVLLPFGASYQNETLCDDTEYYQIDFSIYENGKPCAVVNEPTAVKNIFFEGLPELFKSIYKGYTKNEQGDRLMCIADTLKILALVRKNRSWSNVSDTTNEIFAFIKDNCTSDISACDIAERFHISLSLLEKKLKASYDMSPIKLKNFLRIEKSKHLLAQGCTIEEAAEKTGFCDRYHFTKTFTYFVKQAPSVFISNLRI